MSVLRPIFSSLCVSSVLVLVVACGSSNPIGRAVPGSAHINNTTKFSASRYGVVASPRVTTSRKVRKGGGRRQIGKPYKIKGKWYTPKEEPGYDRSGQASWYGPNFHGRLTANGEIYDQYALTAAHPTFPLPSYARVTNLENGKSVVVRVNDRGPYHAGRVVDLSARASELLDYQRKGVARVRVQYIKQAPLHGLDDKYLAASFRDGGGTVDYAEAQKEDTYDETYTGSVGAAQTLAVRGKDPFLSELEAVRQKKNDSGSTIALRLRKQFILKGQGF